MMAPHVPHRGEQRGDQATGKYSSSLKRIKAENLAPITGVGAPVIDDIKNLGANNAGEDDENTKIPGIVAIDTLLLGIAHADPKPDQDARSDQHAISRQVETANVKKSGEHVSLDAPIAS